MEEEIEELFDKVHIAEYEIGRRDTPLFRFAEILKERLPVLKHFPNYRERQFGIILQIPTVQQSSEIRVFKKESDLDVIGYKIVNGSTLIEATLKDEVLEQVHYETPFSCIEHHLMDCGEREYITVSTIFNDELIALTKRLKKMDMPGLRIKTRKRTHLDDFVRKEIYLVTPAPLTVEEEKLISIAMRSGYLDIPRRITLDELGDITGIPKSTLSNNVRKIYKKILHAHFVESTE